MTEAYIYDALRSPRGKGRKDGALHELTSVNLSAQVLNATSRVLTAFETCSVPDSASLARHVGRGPRYTSYPPATQFSSSCSTASALRELHRLRDDAPDLAWLNMGGGSGLS